MATKPSTETTLVSPDGKREWTPENPVQATNLRAQGWAEKPAKKSAATPAASGN